jgi:hypothetical protein
MASSIRVTGGQTVFGSGIGNTATDRFIVSNAGNTIEDLLGSNLVVNGTAGFLDGDTGTTVNLGAAGNAMDTISLHGSGNLILDSGENGVSGSTIKVTVAGPSAGGGNMFRLGNYGGTNIVSFNGLGDIVNTVVFFAHGTSAYNYVQGAAANTIKTGANAKINLTSGANNTVDTTNSAQTGGSTITIGLPYDGDGYGKLGSAHIKISGDNNTVRVGSSNTTVTGGASSNTIQLADGDNTVRLAGQGNIISVGGGANTIVAGSSATVTAGSGNDTIIAGSNSTITVNSVAGSADTITAGNGVTATASGSVLGITGASNDNFYLNNLAPGSNIVLRGNSDQVFLGSNSSTKVQLSASRPGETVVIQAADPTGSYSGTVEIANFGPDAKIDLQGLLSGDPGNANLSIPGFVPLNSYNAVIQDLKPTGTSVVLSLKGGGSVVFDGSPHFQASEFAFSTNTGPVHV